MVTSSSKSNTQKVVLILFIAAVLALTLVKWYRYEQCFSFFNYALVIARVGYLIASVSLIDSYDNFLVMLVFMYILYFIQLVRLDIVILVYCFFALFDST